VDTPVYQPDVMRTLQSEGFEIGYHYNTLDRCDGDVERAVSLFEAELRALRKEKLDIATTIPHGDPRIKKVGYRGNGDICERVPDLLRRNDLLDVFAGVGERYPGYQYITDLGIRWSCGGGTRDLIRRIQNREWPTIYLLTHPDYWSRSSIRALALQVAARILRGLKINRIIAALRAMFKSSARQG
jgi:hypothetical protein